MYHHKKFLETVLILQNSDSTIVVEEEDSSNDVLDNYKHSHPKIFDKQIQKWGCKYGIIVVYIL